MRRYGRDRDEATLELAGGKLHEEDHAELAAGLVGHDALYKLGTVGCEH